LNNLTGAVSDLENLRRNRMPQTDATVPGTISGQQLLLLEFIMEERIREFASQGFRWFDMRRLSVDPLFGSAAFTHQVYNADGSVQEFTLPVERLVLKIPSKILLENPGMEDNP
jgi:starch-binding outer membrane protein, SusD/RagB family